MTMKISFSLNQRRPWALLIWPCIIALTCLWPAAVFSQNALPRTDVLRIIPAPALIKHRATQAGGGPIRENENREPAMVLASAAVAANGPEDAVGRVETAPTYLRDILPIFMGKCSRCHNSQARFVYNWLDYKTAYADRWELKRRIWDSWKGTYFKESMPISNSPESLAMTDEERQTIKNWALTGATIGVAPPRGAAKSKAEKIELGRKLFTSICAACHQPTGQGVPNVFPPLAGSDFLNSDKNRAIKIVINGRQGELVVNSMKFNNSMPSFPLSDEDIAHVLTYVYNSFGNSGIEVKAEEVSVLRTEPPDPNPIGPKPPVQTSPYE
jgi:mono/diheme cytochrome c family protein